MKRILLIFLTLLCGLGAVAQDDYQPLVREGCTWYYKYTPMDFERTDENGVLLPGKFKFPVLIYELYFEGDTAINGITYKKLKIRYDNGFHQITNHTVAYLREANQRVYGIQTAEESLDLYLRPVIQGEYFEQTGEYLIYALGDDSAEFFRQWAISLGSPEDVTLEQIGYTPRDTVTSQGEHLYGYSFRNNNIAERIGYLSGVYTTNFLDPWYEFRWTRDGGMDHTIRLTHYTDENGDVLFDLPYPWSRDADDNPIYISGYEYYLMYLDELSGVEGVKAADPVRVSVTDGCIRVSGTDDAAGRVSVVNLAGQVVAELPTAGAVTAIPAGDLAPGVYVVRYTSNAQAHTAKVLIP